MKNIFKISLAAILLFSVISCRKKEVLNVDFSKYNLDQPETNTALDQWLNTNLLDPYNMKVIYRFNRYYYGDASVDVAPLKPDNVQPMMQTVLDGYLLPYKKIAGTTFIQNTNPKEWVLYGSAFYQTDGSAIAGTAAGGRRITLYGLNSFSLTPAFVTNRLYVIHHEFTHILNQTVAIPPDFEGISQGAYKQPWTLTPAATAKAAGFLGSYASGSPTEDYAETVATLLVTGQSYYDNYANTIGNVDATVNATAKSRLKLKEANVVNYYTTGLGFDFRRLQREVQNYLKNVVKDPSVTFGYWLNRGSLYKTLTMDMTNDIAYTTYPMPTQFKALYQSASAGIAAIPLASRLNMNSIKLNFTSATAMNVEVSFNQGTTALLAKYAFNMIVDPATSETRFTVAAVGGTDANWVGNANLLKPSLQPILDYLANNTFVADWLPSEYSTVTYTNYAGFYVKGASANYFYGATGQ